MRLRTAADGTRRGTTARRPLHSLAVLVLVCLATAACASKSSPQDEGPAAYGDPGLGGGLGGDDKGGAAGDNGSGDSGNGNGGGPSTTAKGGGNTTTTGRGGAPPTTNGQTPSSVGDTAAYMGARGAAGQFARIILPPEPARKVVIEVMHQQGSAPAPRTLNHVLAVLRQVSGKEVTLLGSHLIPPSDANVSQAEINGWSDRFAKAQQGNGQAVVRLLFLNGAFNGEESVLGVAVRGDTAAVFPEQLRSAASPVVPYATLEDAVTVHELGHLLGLVDIVLKTGRADPEHGNHSRNRGSVMYWAVESDVVSQVLGGPPPTEFDQADLADIASIRKGA